MSEILAAPTNSTTTPPQTHVVSGSTAPLLPHHPSGDQRFAALDQTLQHYKFEPTALIQVLHAAQQLFGYLNADVIRYIASALKLPVAHVYGVITFYSHFHLEQRGRHTVRVCRGTACHVRGSKGVIQAAENYLGLGDGETREDLMFSFETVACLGACALSPVVVADGMYSGKVTPERVEQMLRSIEAAESAR